MNVVFQVFSLRKNVCFCEAKHLSNPISFSVLNIFNAPLELLRSLRFVLQLNTVIKRRYEKIQLK